MHTPLYKTNGDLWEFLTSAVIKLKLKKINPRKHRHLLSMRLQYSIPKTNFFKILYDSYVISIRSDMTTLKKMNPERIGHLCNYENI